MFPIWSLQRQNGQSGEEDQRGGLDGRKVKRDDGTEPMGNTDRDGGGESRTQKMDILEWERGIRGKRCVGGQAGVG